MRVSSLVAAFGAAALLVGVPVGPASAGTGASTYCNDGIGYREVPILTSPVTVGLEIGYSPTAGAQTVMVCYSTTAEGQPGTVTGGVAALHVSLGTNTATPSATAGLFCVPDYTTGVGTACNSVAYATATPGDVVVATPPSTFCLVALGSGCVAYVPLGAAILTDATPRPLLHISVAGLPVTVNVPPPAQCVAAFVPCP